MKVFFLARHFTYFRNFESVVVGLAARGHHVHLAAEREESLGGRRLVERLAAAHPTITLGDAPVREEAAAGPLAARLRLGVDFLRYLDPPYDRTPRLRTRAEERVPQVVARLAAHPAGRWRPVRRVLGAVLRAAERGLPASAAVEAHLRAAAPDVLLVTPLIGLDGSPQIDYVRAARALGIPSALCVWSWDHLSSKALIRDRPDRVIVWNGTQRDEAVRLHGVPAGRVAVTGAQCYDQWFDRAPARDRAAFCARVGLPADRPFVLYVCSALFRGSPPEADFVRRWIAALRACPDARLREAGVLVRPHPQRAAEWETPGLEGLGPAVLWGDNPIDAGTRDDYFDSLYHSAAVVGLNTSALLEAGIVGRPVYTILDPAFRENQEGTIHFHYLTGVAGGLLHTARSLEAHVAQLAEGLARPAAARRDAFVRAFIRPRGLGSPATPAFVEAVEALAVETPARVPARGSAADRVAYRATARLAATAIGREWLLDARELRNRAYMEAKRRRAAAQAEERAARTARHERARAQRDEARTRKLDAWRRQKRETRAR